MIAVRLLSKKEIAKRLSAFGCSKTKEMLDDENVFWVTPWNHHFTVPEIGPDKVCADYVLDRIIDEIKKTQPKGN